jgi:AcrR family transcriptional regulator
MNEESESSRHCETTAPNTPPVARRPDRISPSEPVPGRLCDHDKRTGTRSAARHEAADDRIPRPRRVPGRPRSEQANNAIMTATLEILEEGVPVDTLSVEAVAARAGVGKATVYRRWPNKYVMVAAAIGSLDDTPVPVTGDSCREDLVVVLRDLHCWAAAGPSARVLPRLLNSMRTVPVIRNEYYRVVLEPRIAALRSVLRRGLRRRELRTGLDIDAAVAVLAGPALASIVLPDSPAIDRPESGVHQIVDLFMAGAENEAPTDPTVPDNHETGA